MVFLWTTCAWARVQPYTGLGFFVGHYWTSYGHRVKSGTCSVTELAPAWQLVWTGLFLQYRVNYFEADGKIRYNSIFWQQELYNLHKQEDKWHCEPSLFHSSSAGQDNVCLRNSIYSEKTAHKHLTFSHVDKENL